ncbi:MAG: DUF4446 family protein [Schwartzia sp.]|nr:DUF4446 family protein [Schwartzia sp. (in: firmicutes)]
MEEILKLITLNANYIIVGLSGLVLLLFFIIIWQGVSISGLKKRYNKMMSGEETGASFEKMMLDHIDQVRVVSEKIEKLNEKNKELDALLQLAITNVGVVRFRAFEDMGSDLSYAVALLDSNHDGVILSSIFDREDSRSYVKPIEKGKSSYTLTKEEEEAMRKALNG